MILHISHDVFFTIKPKKDNLIIQSLNFCLKMALKDCNKRIACYFDSKSSKKMLEICFKGME